MKKESFIFYESWYEAIKGLPRDMQGEIYTAIMEYSLYGNEIANLKPIAKSMFTLIKPLIEANRVRFENGKKGGRPRKDETEQKPNENQNETELKPSENRNETKSKPNVNVNVNDNVNVNVNEDIESELKNSPPSQNSNSDFENLENENSNSELENHLPKNQNSEKRKKVATKKESLTIEQRAENFKTKIWKEVKGTERENQTDELCKFWEYWSEHGENDRKMRYEKEKSFNILRRLNTWFENAEKWRKYESNRTNSRAVNSTITDEELAIQVEQGIARGLAENTI